MMQMEALILLLLQMLLTDLFSCVKSVHFRSFSGLYKLGKTGTIALVKTLYNKEILILHQRTSLKKWTYHYHIHGNVAFWVFLVNVNKSAGLFAWWTIKHSSLNHAYISSRCKCFLFRPTLQQLFLFTGNSGLNQCSKFDLCSEHCGNGTINVQILHRDMKYSFHFLLLPYCSFYYFYTLIFPIIFFFSNSRWWFQSMVRFRSVQQNMWWRYSIQNT